MKRIIYSILFACLVFASCEKEQEHKAVPIAPLLKDIKMPLESNTIPGENAVISGKGFDETDVIRCKSVEGESFDFIAEVVEVTDYAVTVAIPEGTFGPYEVTVERAGLSTTLDVYLNVAYILYLEDIEVPEGNFRHGDAVSVKVAGLEAGDRIAFSSDAYPEAHFVETDLTLTQDGASFVIPNTCYGVNKVMIKRGKRQGVLGNLNILVSVGDVLGGGVVYYVSDGGLHGLIVNKVNIGKNLDVEGGQNQWGPTTSHGTTSEKIYTGKENTRICVEAMVDFHQRFATWPLDKKSSAEMCDEYKVTVDGVEYDDWFLPSQEELVELFRQRSVVTEKGAAIPNNNYWSSTQGVIDGDATAHHWTAFYVNFYEPETLITAVADKELWKIAVRPVRQF